MPKGATKQRLATGTPDAPLYVKEKAEAASKAETPPPAVAPAPPVMHVPDSDPAPIEEAPEQADSSIPSIGEALSRMQEQSKPATDQGAPPLKGNEDNAPAEPDKKAAPKAEASPAKKPDSAKPEDATARLRSDLAAKTRNEQQYLARITAAEADTLAARQEADEIAAAALAGEDVAAVRQKWADQNAQRQTQNTVAEMGFNIDLFLEEAGFARDEKNPKAFAPHPVVDYIARVFARDPKEAERLAFEEWRRATRPTSSQPESPARPTSSQNGATNAAPKTYTQDEVNKMLAEAAKRAQDDQRDAALSSASTANIPDGVVGKDLDKAFWDIEDPSEKIRYALHKQKG